MIGIGTDIEKVKRLYDEKKKYPKDFGEKVTIQEFKASGMPALSQDQWSGQPSMTASGLTNLEFDKMYALTFELDVMDHYEERSEENNSISADIILRRDYDKCT